MLTPPVSRKVPLSKITEKLERVFEFGKNFRSEGNCDFICHLFILSNLRLVPVYPRFLY